MIFHSLTFARSLGKVENLGLRRGTLRMFFSNFYFKLILQHEYIFIIPVYILKYIRIYMRYIFILIVISTESGRQKRR